jgi:hypothetical protein
MQSVKVKTTGGKTVEITTDELLPHFLHFCRKHFAEHKSEILLGENAREQPEFVITPVLPKNPRFEITPVKHNENEN